MLHKRLYSARKLTGPRLFVTLTIAFFIMIAPVAARTWTSRDGKTLKGTYVRFEDGNVLIERDKDGKTKSIPLERFSDKDQRYVEKRVDAEVDNAAVVTDDAESDTEAADESPADSPLAGLGKIVAMGIVAIIISMIVGFAFIGLFWAIGVHIAARMLKFEGTFLTACLSVAYMFGITLMLALVTLPVKMIASGGGAAASMAIISFLLSLFLCPFGIKASYSEDYWPSFFAYLLSFLVLLVGSVLFGCGLGALAMLF